MSDEDKILSDENTGSTEIFTEESSTNAQILNSTYFYDEYLKQYYREVKPQNSSDGKKCINVKKEEIPKNEPIRVEDISDYQIIYYRSKNITESPSQVNLIGSCYEQESDSLSSHDH